VCRTIVRPNISPVLIPGAILYATLVAYPSWIINSLLFLHSIVSGIVDEMPSTVLQELTGDVEGFDRAEEILTLPLIRSTNVLHLR
jgi:hypothetical protein